MTRPRTILALDQGTTSSRALVVAADGRILGRGQQEFGQHFPSPGWVEHDPMEIWTTTLAAARAAIAMAGVTPEAIGITNQRETLVVWDAETGHPVAPAIVWQDRRTAARCTPPTRGAPRARCSSLSVPYTHPTLPTTLRE